MAIITSAALIRALSLFHISLSYFLIASPSTIVNQSLVFILGASMQLVSPRAINVRDRALYMMSSSYFPIPKIAYLRKISPNLFSSPNTTANTRLLLHLLTIHYIFRSPPRPARSHRPDRLLPARRDRIPVLGFPSPDPECLLLHPERLRFRFQTGGRFGGKGQQQSVGYSAQQRRLHLEFLGDDLLVLGKFVGLLLCTLFVVVAAAAAACLLFG